MRTLEDGFFEEGLSLAVTPRLLLVLNLMLLALFYQALDSDPQLAMVEDPAPWRDSGRYTLVVRRANLAPELTASLPALAPSPEAQPGRGPLAFLFEEAPPRPAAAVDPARARAVEVLAHPVFQAMEPPAIPALPLAARAAPVAAPPEVEAPELPEAWLEVVAAAETLAARAPIQLADLDPEGELDEPTEVAGPAEPSEGAGPAEPTEEAGPAEPTEVASPAEPTEVADAAESTEGAAAAEPTEGAASAASTEVAGPAEPTEVAAQVETTVERYRRIVRAASAKLRKRDHRAAVKLLDQVLGLEDVVGEQRAWALYLKARALRRLGKLKPALRLYAEAIDHDPPGTRYKNSLAWVLATAKTRSTRDAEAAVSLAEEVVAEGGATGQYLDTLARAYFSAGRLADAVRTQQRAVDRWPGNDGVRNRLAWYQQEWAGSTGVLTGAP